MITDPGSRRRSVASNEPSASAPGPRQASIKPRRIIAAITLLLALVAALPPGTANADEDGSRLYSPSSASEANAYARVIQLQHAGSQNGRLLATFEHWTTDDTPAQLIIRDSDNDGQSWSTLATVGDPQTGPGHPVSHMWQPFLFEFPRQLGGYPAGTLLLVANLVPADASYTEFFEWRSTDHGATWTPVGSIQRGGTFNHGIWEPFLGLDRAGRLLMYFSDERDSPQHSQMLVHVVSTDGGAHWGTVVQDVASSVSADRPGMPTVARIGTRGQYVMSFEVCGRPNCEVRYKYSSDGDDWNATDLGQRAVTTDGRYLGGSPYVVWDPAINGLVLSGHFVYQTINNQTTGENLRAVFVNTNRGRGAWSWAPAPWHVSDASSECNANYSPDLLVESGGIVRYTAPTSVGSSGPCGEATGTAPIGVLPYESAFATAGDAGWADYGGCWSVTGDVYETTCSSDAPKALTGSTGWSDYRVAADVKITSSSGDAGVLARVSNPAVGPDSHDGYTAYFDVSSGMLTIARQEYSYEPLATVPVPGGLRQGTWYRLTFTVQHSSLTATLQPPGGQATTVTTTDPYNSFPSGMAGVRTHAGTAAYRNVTISPEP